MSQQQQQHHHQRLTQGQFLGTPLVKQAIPGLILMEARYDAGLELPRHSHANAYLCLIGAGGYRERYGLRSERECGPGMLVFHPAGEDHAQSMGSEPTLSFNVELDGAWVAETGLCRQSGSVRGGRAAWIAGRLQSESRAPMEPTSALRIESLLWELAGEPASPTGPPVWIERARALLEDRFAEPIRLQEIAAEAGVRPARLVQAFRRRYQMTPGDYLRHIRVSRARALLLRSDLPLAAVASLCGFADQSHLTRLFRQTFGVTPAAFRAKSGSRRNAQPWPTLGA